MQTRVACATCDGAIRFGVTYTTDAAPGKVFCCAHCTFRYEQAKLQRDRGLRLQPIASDECRCALCTDP